MAGKVIHAMREVEVFSVEELDSIVDRAHAESRTEPSVLELVLESGDTMSIGIGREITVLSSVASSMDPPYFASLGDASANGFVSFMYGGHVTEFPMSQAIPMSVARAALRDFYVSGGLSDAIEWQQVEGPTSAQSSRRVAPRVRNSPVRAADARSQSSRPNPGHPSARRRSLWLVPRAIAQRCRS
jgi:Immunity protein Imm1